MSSCSTNDFVLNQTQAGPSKQKSQQRGPPQSNSQWTDQLASSTIDLDSRQTYAYQHLDDSKNEIRLVTILPGNHGDPLEISLHHVSLDPLPRQPPPKILSLDQLRETLPPGWNVYQTREERILFEGPDKTTSWVHPYPHVSPTSYDITLYSLQETGDAPEYEALSYTWGSLIKVEAVVVYSGLKSSADPKPSVLQIGANLSEALQYLRLQDEGRVMWIDALCINQDDLEERGHQVRRMVNIYSRARKVIAWLGPDRDDAVKALQGLEHVGKQVEVTNSFYFARSPGASEPTWHDPIHPVPFDDYFWAAVIDLIQRPWFSRVWVIQEIHMGNVNSFLKCGLNEIPWSLFQRAVRCLAVKGPDCIAQPHIARLNTMCGIAPGQNFDFFLSTLGASHYCLDPRDIIYGILSLAPAELQEALCVDYSSDTELVYKQFFATYTSLQHRSDLLTFTGWPVAATESTSRPWPSWVPDWRSGIPALQGLLFTVASASGQSCSEMVFGAEPHNSLRIKGVLLDETISTLLVEDIGHMPEVLQTFKTLVGRNKSKDTMPESDNCQIETMYRYIDAIHQGLTADHLVDPPLWVQSREQLRQDVFQNPDFSLESDESLPSWWFNYKRFIDFWWPGMKLFLTNRGHPGVCKWEVQSGMFVIANTSPDCATNHKLTKTYQARLFLYLLAVFRP